VTGGRLFPRVGFVGKVVGISMVGQFLRNAAKAFWLVWLSVTVVSFPVLFPL